MNYPLKQIFKNIIGSPGYFLKEYWHFFSYYKIFSRPSYNGCKFLNGEETIDRLLKTRKSFIRLGEGEFSILYGLNVDLYKEKHNADLRKYLLEIVESYNENSPYLLAVPVMPVREISYSGIKKEKNSGFWYKTEAFMSQRIKKELYYGDPLVFKRVLNENIKSSLLWQGKAVLLVGSMAELLKNKQIESNRGQYLIKAPVGDSFRQWKDIFKNITEAIKNNNLKKEEIIILISLGPAAKVLVYELSKKGFRAYDMGTYFDLRYK